LAKKLFDQMHGPLDQVAFSIFLSHHYRIQSSIRQNELIDDLLDFKKMLDKFDFIALFSQILFANGKQYISRSRRLIRILKWRTL
jgi:hypothetical protein